MPNPENYVELDEQTRSAWDCLLFHIDKNIHETCWLIQRRKYKFMIFVFFTGTFLVSSGLFTLVYRSDMNTLAAIWFGILTTLGIFLALFAACLVGFFLITKCFDCYKNKISEYHDYLVYMEEGNLNN